jgi:hypothetical protein
MNRKVLLLIGLLATMAVAQDWIKLSESFQGNDWEGLDDWVHTQAASNDVVFTCGSQKIVGGPKAFGRRATLAKLFKVPSHY